MVGLDFQGMGSFDPMKGFLRQRERMIPAPRLYRYLPVDGRDE
jgi:hypothetical protein